MEKLNVTDAERGTTLSSGSEVEGAVFVNPAPDPFLVSHSCSPASSTRYGNGNGGTETTIVDKVKSKLNAGVATMKPAVTRTTTRARGAVGNLKPKLNARLTSMTDSVTSVGPIIQHKSLALKEATRERMIRVGETLQGDPVRLAGVATGVGFAVGLVGRYMKWRMKHPRMIVINAAAVPECV